MTIYDLSIISTTGFPYFNSLIKPTPEGVNLFLRFFDFSKDRSIFQDQLDPDSKFDLTAGLISALFEFAKNIDKKIEVLEFKPKKDKNSQLMDEVEELDQGDVLITTQTESFLLNRSVREKIKLIYKLFINSKLPLDSADNIQSGEENKIVNILTDLKARDIILNHKDELDHLASDFLIEMSDYGLWGICITSFDLSPLITFGKKYSLNNINEILRHIGYIPEIIPLEWIYRQSFFSNEQIQVCIIKSDTGPTIEDILFEPYFYLLFADPLSYFGEFPTKLTSSFNNILG
ncbi:hypothetical protein LCGC14_0964110 [marine sediment metagenome]|uniref:Uncharacterized protein n=1 Tax=marine sediment metagenome TaxID=412755 RepID=A0A0F9NDP4_9ZZZZ